MLWMRHLQNWIFVEVQYDIFTIQSPKNINRILPPPLYNVAKIKIGRNWQKLPKMGRLEQVIYMSKTDTKPIVSKYLLLILPTSQHLSKFSSSYFEFLLFCLILLSNGQIWYFAVWSKYPSITVYAVWVKIACPN